MQPCPCFEPCADRLCRFACDVGMPLIIGHAALAAHPFSQAGPGAGAGAIAVLIVVVLGVLLLFAGVFWYPIKRMVRSRRGQASAEEDAGR